MDVLNITSGDMAGKKLVESGVPGEVFVWHDILYDGPREPGWPSEKTLRARSIFLEGITGGGLSRKFIYRTLEDQYGKLRAIKDYENLLLWVDACLFDQSMLCHILACIEALDLGGCELICVDSYPGVAPFHGLGQMSPAELASVYPRKNQVTTSQYLFAKKVDAAFAAQDVSLFVELAQTADAPLPWIPAAVNRWLKEIPAERGGLGLLERLALAAIKSGCETWAEVYACVSAQETPPQYWTDVTLLGKINNLAERGLIRIEGPATRLPQWECVSDRKLFRFTEAR